MQSDNAFAKLQEYLRISLNVAPNLAMPLETGGLCDIVSPEPILEKLDTFTEACLIEPTVTPLELLNMHVKQPCAHVVSTISSPSQVGILDGIFSPIRPYELEVGEITPITSMCRKKVLAPDLWKNFVSTTMCPLEAVQGLNTKPDVTNNSLEAYPPPKNSPLMIVQTKNGLVTIVNAVCADEPSCLQEVAPAELLCKEVLSTPVHAPIPLLVEDAPMSCSKDADLFLEKPCECSLNVANSFSPLLFDVQEKSTVKLQVTGAVTHLVSDSCGHFVIPTTKEVQMRENKMGKKPMGDGDNEVVFPNMGENFECTETSYLLKPGFLNNAADDTTVKPISLVSGKKVTHLAFKALGKPNALQGDVHPQMVLASVEDGTIVDA